VRSERQRRQRRGIIVVLTSFLLTVLFAFVALSVDTGRVVLTETKMQNAVDAASLAASQEITAAVYAAGQGQGSANIGHYVAAKWGVLGLVKSLAVEVAEHGVTVNAVCPTSVDSEMIQNETFHRLFLPDADEIHMADVEAAYTTLNPIPVPWLSPGDVSDAVLFLASDEARFITGDALPVALGWNARMAA
jgi:NAD(P)-dependent dehydrogenase (short-subunit alcohol dehydrogenase family)